MNCITMNDGNGSMVIAQSEDWIPMERSPTFAKSYGGRRKTYAERTGGMLAAKTLRSTGGYYTQFQEC